MADSGVQFGLSTLLTVSTLELIIGTVIGRFLRSRAGDPSGDDPETARLRETQRQQSELLDQTLARVSQLTGNIGKDVGAHTSRVQQIGHDLQLASKTPEANLHNALMGAMSSVAEANEQLQKQLHDAEQKLIDQAFELQTQVAIARTDKLTGLLNRRAYDDALAQRLGEFQRYGVFFSLLLLDIDRFKLFNDTHGHQAGDEVLRGVAQSLVHAMRDVDIVCRYGGEEFAILMPATDLDGAAIAAERARQQIEAAVIRHAGKPLRVTFSGGVANVLPGESVAEIVGRADRALYAAKNAGRNCVYLHDGENCVRLTASIVPPAAEFNQPRQPQSEPAVSAPSTQIETQPPAATDCGLPEETVDFDHFKQQLQSAIESHHRSGTEVSMVVGCVDRLAEIDQREGPQAVDLALRAAMQVVRAVLREPNTLARIAEDQIGLVLSTVGSNRAMTIIERARMAIEKCRLAMSSKHLLSFTMSFAVVEVQRNDNVETLVARGFEALALATAAGGNQVQAMPVPQPVAASVLESHEPSEVCPA